MHRELCEYTEITVPRLLRDRAEKYSSQPFIIFLNEDGNENSWSYSDFFDEVKKIAGGLQERGVEQGDKVFIHLDNSPEFLLAWFACAQIGAVSVLSNTANSSELIAYCFESSSSKVAITHSSYGVLIDQALDARLIVVNYEARKCEVGGRLRNRVEDFSRLSEGGKQYAEPCIKSLDPVSVVFTSGSTGRPKGVVWTHTNVFKAGQTNAQQLYLNKTDTTYCHLPLFHVTALSYQVFTTFWAGGTVVLQPKFDVGRFWDISIKYKCTWAVMVGYDVAHLMKREVPKHYYNFWYTSNIVSGWEKMFSVKTIGGWGMSETARPYIVSDRYIDEPFSAIGHVPFNSEVKILTESGALIKPGETGELFVRGIRGVSIFLEYLNNPEATAECFDEDGWFKTKDRIKLDESGFLSFVERMGDVLKVAGENVSSRAIETVIYESELISEVCVVGQADNFLGELPVAFVIPKKNTPENVAEILLQICRERLATFMVPHRIITVDEFPRSQLNKVAKHLLKERLSGDAQIDYLSRPDLPSNYQVPETAIQKQLADIWSHVFYMKTVGVDDDFFELGGNSLLAVKISGQIEQACSITLPINTIYEAGTIRQLAAHIGFLKYTPTEYVSGKDDSSSTEVIEF